MKSETQLIDLTHTLQPGIPVRAGLLVPLLLIFITQLGGGLFLPDLVRMLGQSQHFLNPDIPKTTRKSFARRCNERPWNHRGLCASHYG